MALKDPEARKKYQREYRLAHLAEYTQRDREYRQNHADEVRKRNQRYRDNNRDKSRAWTLKANRKWRAAHTKEFSQYCQEWRKKHPEIRAAHVAVYEAIKRGILVRPDHCQLCGVKCRPHGHHDDYSKPLEVIWLCCPCHKQADYRRAALSSYPKICATAGRITKRTCPPTVPIGSSGERATT